MDISGPSVTGALKYSLQIISSHKRPLLEVYHQVCNRFGPEEEYQTPKGIDGKENTTHKLRHQEIFIQFTLANIGGQRAEDVGLSIEGNLRKHGAEEELGESVPTTIPQMAPGQILFLFILRDHDITEYPEEGGKALGLKQQTLTITATYDAPKGLLNFVLSIPSRIRKKKRFVMQYTFFPQMLSGDLPPAEYM